MTHRGWHPPLVRDGAGVVVPAPEGGADNDIPAPIPFADDSDTRAYRANVNTCRTPTPRFPIWRFLFAAAALPPLLVFPAAASWLTWMCFQGAMGTAGRRHCHSGTGSPHDGTWASALVPRCR